MTDTSHLVAISDRIQRERARLAAARNQVELRYRERQIAQAEKELKAEYEFLGMEPELPTISDDDLYAELSN